MTVKYSRILSVISLIFPAILVNAESCSQKASADGLYWCGPYGNTTATSPSLSFSCQASTTDYISKISVLTQNSDIVSAQFTCKNDTQSPLFEVSGNYTLGVSSQPPVITYSAPLLAPFYVVSTYSNGSRINGINFDYTLLMGTNDGVFEPTKRPPELICEFAAVSAVVGRTNNRKGILSMSFGFQCRSSPLLGWFDAWLKLLLGIYLTYFIIGCVVVFLLLCCTIGLCIYCCRRKKKEVHVNINGNGQAGQPWWLNNA